MACIRPHDGSPTGLPVQAIRVTSESKPAGERRVNWVLFSRATDEHFAAVHEHDGVDNLRGPDRLNHRDGSEYASQR